MSDEFELFLSGEPHKLPAPPRDLGEVATIAANHMQGAIVLDEVRHLVLLTFSGAEVSTWILKGKPPAPVDDIIRGLAAQSGCEALAFVHATPVPREVSADRVMNVAVEGRDGSVDILYAMTGAVGAPDATFQIFHRPHGEKRRWLGVPTTWRFQLFRKGPGFGEVPTGEA